MSSRSRIGPIILHSALCILHLENWSARQDLHLRSLGPKPSVLAATLGAEGPGGPEKPRRGFGFLWRRAASFPGTRPIGRLADLANAKCRMQNAECTTAGHILHS